MKDEYIDEVRHAFNLNLYEAKIWIALLTKGSGTAGQLSDLAGVPRSRTYDTLESLERRGFVRLRVGKPAMYEAIPPSEVIENVKSRIEKDLEQRRKKIERIKSSATIKSLENLYKSSISSLKPTDVVLAIRGRDNIYSKLASMISNAKDSVYIVTTSTGLLKKLNALGRHIEKARKKGVNIHIAAPITEDVKPMVSRMKGVKFKNLGKLNSRFVVVDGEHAFMMLAHDEEIHPDHDVALWVRSPMVAKTMQEMFHKL